MQNLFEYKIDHITDERKVVGHLKPTGLRPTFLPKFERHGLELPEDMFGTPDTAVYGAQGSPMTLLGEDGTQRGSYR